MALAEQTFGFFMPSISLLGVGSSKAAGMHLKGLGASNTLIVTDKVLVKLGVVENIKALLEAAGVNAIIFDGVEPNPTEATVAQGVKVYLQNKCDALLSLGGGSAHDSCKAIGVVVSHGGKISDYAGPNKCKKALPPFVAINTTAGSGSEVTCIAVITSQDRVKYGVVDWRLMPIVAINDPVLMASMPSGMTAATGMDALTHAVEAYVSVAHNPVSDCCALGAVELVAKYLRPAVANGQNIEARDKMSYAEFLAGMAFNSASLGLVHAMAHQPGGKLNLPHGVCNAICLPIVCEFNMIAIPERYAEVARALGEDVTGLTTMEAAGKGVAAMRQLSKDIGIPSGLAQLGAKESDVPVLAELAMKDPCIFTNPRAASAKDVVELFKLALGEPLAAAAGK
jgi:alcohol dehydrogenase